MAHDELVSCAEASFGRAPEGLLTPDEQSEYIGGVYACGGRVVTRYCLSLFM